VGAAAELGIGARLSPRVPAGTMKNRCAHHAERPALALCMGCRKALCQECATTFEGIHYCAACLAEQRTARGGAMAWGGWTAVALALAGLTWLHARLLVIVGVMLAAMR
jgi:hypothetical protein